MITRVDIDSYGDFHIIDDVQFGRIGDGVAPTAMIASPLDGATFNLRQAVTAEYTCSDDGGSELVSCEGQVPSGSALDTSAPGTFPFVVTATDGAGNTTHVSASYTVLPEPIFGVAGVAPSARAQGSGAHTVIVTGDGFLPGTRARVSGTGVSVSSTSVLSATTLEVPLSVGAGAPIGPRDVIVTHPDGSAVTCTGCFTVNARPTVSAVAPASRPRGATDVSLAVTGSGLQPRGQAAFAGLASRCTA